MFKASNLDDLNKIAAAMYKTDNYQDTTQIATLAVFLIRNGLMQVVTDTSETTIRLGYEHVVDIIDMTVMHMLNDKDTIDKDSVGGFCQAEIDLIATHLMEMKVLDPVV